jgi:hypothetical protein
MKKLFALLFLFALPVLTFGATAQKTGSSGITDADSLIAKANKILDAIIPIFIAFAVVYLIYAIVRFVIATDEEGRAKGKSMVGWGILGLFLILSIWGLVNILVNTLDLSNDVPDGNIPTVSDIPIRKIN